MAQIGNLNLAQQVLVVKEPSNIMGDGVLIEAGGEAWRCTRGPGLQKGPNFETGREYPMIIEALAAQGYHTVTRRKSVVTLREEATLQKVDSSAPDNPGATVDFKFDEVAYTGQPNFNSGCCFVATACYGSYDHPDVVVFRHWRDEVLMLSVSGRAFVRLYYAVAPPIAAFIVRLPHLASLIRRLILQPLAHNLRMKRGLTKQMKEIAHYD